VGSPEQIVEQRVIGLISGTSVDGIDAALVDISGTDYDLHVQLLTGQTFPYPPQLRERILAVCGGASLSMAELAELDDAIATEFAHAAIAIQAEHSPADLIGSHGQTVYHYPPQADRLGYSLQLGRGIAIAARTGITTVNNFRAADIAAGGQGAPLVSRVDAYLLGHPTYRRCIQNLGGIGNFTYLPALGASPLASSGWDREILGGDTGPSNVLIDLAVQQLTQGQQTYDQDGAWAANGKPCIPLVEHWLKHPFFQLPPPKSTGRELFGEAYLQQCLADAAPYQLSSADLLATLTELTACSVAQHYQRFLPQMPDQVLLCGGGSRNQYLKQRLQYHFGSIPVLTTEDAGVSVDFKEAIAFAVLAYWRQRQIPGNLPVVTGAAQALPLGDIAAVIGDKG
jgi:anhydro-N-acetylmuramic acid kinase